MRGVENTVAVTGLPSLLLNLNSQSANSHKERFIFIVSISVLGSSQTLSAGMSFNQLKQQFGSFSLGIVN